MSTACEHRATSVRPSISTVIMGQRALLREGLTSILQHTAYRIVATAATPAELKDMRLPAARRLIVILGVDGSDVSIGELGESIHLLRSLVPRCTIVVVVEASAPIDVQRIIEFAPDGLIVNPGSRDILVKSLELSLMDRQVFVMGRLASSPAAGSSGSQDHEKANGAHSVSDLQPATAPNTPRLSQRERQILTCLARGDSNKAIARLCNIAESTVKVHLKAILRKTDANNRTQAAIWAFTRGFVGETVETWQSLKPKPAVEAVVYERNGSLPHVLIPVAKPGQPATVLEHK